MADEGERKNVDFSRIKNKIQRSEVYWKEKIRKAKEKRERRKKRKREEDALGDEVNTSFLDSNLLDFRHVQSSSTLDSVNARVFERFC